jgi:hypothetical protein
MHTPCDGLRKRKAVHLKRRIVDALAGVQEPLWMGQKTSSSDGHYSVDSLTILVLDHSTSRARRAPGAW